MNSELEEKIRFVLVARSFHAMAGGVERMAISIMNEMIARGHDVTLITWDYKNAKTFYPMDPQVKWIKLDLGSPQEKSGWLVRYRRALIFRKTIKKFTPQVILAFQHGIFLATYFYLFGMNIPIIASERNAPSRFNFIASGKNKEFVFQSLRLATGITVQFSRYIEGYPEFLRGKIHVIHNSVLPQEINRPSKRERKILLSVGRLSFQKNFLVLIRAFSALASKYPNWDLVIVGEGEQKDLISQEIIKHNMSKRVIIRQPVSNIESEFRKADIFCLASFWEGFPNALAEALSFGIPSVGFANCSGVCDLIINESNGLLAEGLGNADSLKGSLRKLMQDKDLRIKMSKNAHSSVRKYNPKEVFDNWEQYLLKVSRK